MELLDKQLAVDKLRSLMDGTVAAERYAYHVAIKTIEGLSGIVCEQERKPYVKEHILQKYGEDGFCPHCIHRMVCAVEDPSHPTYDCQYFDVVRPCDRTERV